MHVRTLWRSSMLALLTAAACASAPRSSLSSLTSYPSDLRAVVRVDYYDVRGRTATEVSAGLRRSALAGRRQDFGAPIPATHSPIRSQWRVVSAPTGRCRAQDVQVSMNVQLMLPRWAPPEGTDSATIRDWNHFLEAVAAHEAGHKAIAVDAARDLVAR